MQPFTSFTSWDKNTSLGKPDFVFIDYDADSTLDVLENAGGDIEDIEDLASLYDLLF